MTQEEKSLILSDICCRLPYGVHVEISWEYSKADVYTSSEYYEFPNIDSLLCMFWDEKCISIKSYLRPLSSMTREEKRCLNAIAFEFGEKFLEPEADAISRWNATAEVHARSMDYLNSIHVDCRNLIPMGLALEAPEDMYK